MEQYLWAFATYEQDNWLDLLPLAEFGYVQQLGACDHGTYPDLRESRLSSRYARQVTEGSLVAGENRGEAARQATGGWDRPRESILEAQARKTKYAGGKKMF
jgi:hypothetical protein